MVLMAELAFGVRSLRLIQLGARLLVLSTTLGDSEAIRAITSDDLGK